jgi:hypothetical protein
MRCPAMSVRNASARFTFGVESFSTVPWHKFPRDNYTSRGGNGTSGPCDCRNDGRTPGAGEKNDRRAALAAAIAEAMQLPARAEHVSAAAIKKAVVDASK